MRGSNCSFNPQFHFICVQALELESPFTGTVLVSLRSSMEERWTNNWSFPLCRVWFISASSPKSVWFVVRHVNVAVLASRSSLNVLLVVTQRWFFYPPDQEPHFDPNRTTLSWVTETYPHLPEDEAPLECTIRPGEVTTRVHHQTRILTVHPKIKKYFYL